MFYEKKGDIFQVQSGIIMHGCNCYGFMGAGVAALVRSKYPKAYLGYKAICQAHSGYEPHLLGTVHCPKVTDDLQIANCFTQLQPGPYARLSAIADCLRDVMDYATEQKLSVHSVQIGCGIGGLDWSDVKKIYAETARQHPKIDLTVWSV